MAITAKIEVEQGDILSSIRGFLKKILQRDEIAAMLVPHHLPMKQVVMPVLTTEPEMLNSADPLTPAFSMNGASLVSKLTRKPAGGQIAATLRPCEIRAFTELVKLNQGSRDELLTIGIDCFGAYTNRDYRSFAEKKSASIGAENGYTHVNNENLSTACKSCDHPIPYGADILIGLLGVDTEKNLLVQGLTTKGESLINLLGLSQWEEPPERKSVIETFIEGRKAYRDKMFAKTAEATNTLEKLTAYLAECVNCYNCRVACPVCYCKECVFVTDVFKHDPSQYLQWAARKGGIKMPNDTLFYHLTRLAHMSTACVGCGQCSNACPNDIPVMELFRTIAHITQRAFSYEAGISFDQPPPLSQFREEEFPEVEGIK